MNTKVIAYVTPLFEPRHDTYHGFLRPVEAYSEFQLQMIELKIKV